MARFTKLIALAALLLAPTAVFAQGSTKYAGTETNAALELQPLLQAPRMAPLKWYASTDKTGGNDDFARLKPGETRRIPLAAGNLERLWSTAEFPNEIELKLVTQPRRTVPLLVKGQARVGLFADKAYTLFPAIRSTNLRELKAGAYLEATNHAKAPSKWYYQVSVRPKSSTPLPAIPKADEASRRLFKLTLAPGEQKSIENFKTPGLIFELGIAVNEGSEKDIFHKLRLLGSWEGKTAVNAPLMSLAGQVEGEEFIQNAIADYDGEQLSLTWPMPFENGILALKNESDHNVSLDVTARIQLFDKAPSAYRFCAIEGSAIPEANIPVSITQLKGEGAFVGLALFIAPGKESTRRTFAFLEGDEIITADGQKMEGTGTEDYFSSAWYYPDKPYTHLYDGMTLKTQMPPTVAAYRFHIWDAIPFRNSFDFKFEHGSSNNAPGMEWNWVALWYQKPPLSVPEASSQISSQGEATGARGKSWMLIAAAGAGVLLVILALILNIVRSTRRT